MLDDKLRQSTGNLRILDVVSSQLGKYIPGLRETGAIMMLVFC